MKKAVEIIWIEAVLFLRDFFGFFFTFIFPVMMLLLYGSIYGNEPSAYFGGQGAMDVSVPAYSAMIIGVTGLMAFPLTLACYKEHNTYKRFDATPAGKGSIMAAQAFVNLFMAVAGFILLFVVGKAVYHIKVAGSLLAIGPALLLSVSAIFALGFFITAIAPNEKICNLLCYILYFVMIFLSGSTMPKELFPDSVRHFSQFLPLTHVVTILQGSFRGAPLREYGQSVLVLGGLLVLCTAGGAALYKKKSWI